MIYVFWIWRKDNTAAARGAPACIHAWKEPKEPVREERGIEPGRAAMQGLGDVGAGPTGYPARKGEDLV